MLRRREQRSITNCMLPHSLVKLARVSPVAPFLSSHVHLGGGLRGFPSVHRRRVKVTIHAKVLTLVGLMESPGFSIPLWSP